MSAIAISHPTPPPRATVATRLVDLLWQLGVRQAYGICGREVIAIWAALLESAGTGRPIETLHGRDETGAGTAAIGSWFVTGEPVAIFVTTGPGITNVITALETARQTGAKLILLSPLTPAVERGRFGIQDTSAAGYANPDLYLPGRTFDLVAAVESPDQLPALAGQLAAGLAGPGGFLAHIAIPTRLQAEPIAHEIVVPQHRRPAPGIAPELADELAALLADEPFAVWAGFGARRHARRIRELLDVTGAPAVCSPRGLGIVDTHPAFAGVTGNGGRASVAERLAAAGVQRTLVLGSRLSEATSGWLPGLVPPAGFVHVDLDASVFARAYPNAPTLGIQADVGAVLDALLARKDRLRHRPAPVVPTTDAADDETRRPGRVHPADLMAAIQRVIVDGTDMPVIADASSAMFWTARHLTFATPGRYFTENTFGAMGFAGAMVVGSAAGRGGSALAICGDGAMHMVDELNTAVRYGTHAIWVVLNDGGLGVVKEGMAKNGRLVHDADFPPTDFAGVARAKGLAACRVSTPEALDAALVEALSADGPFLVDVVTDGDAPRPIETRFAR